MGEEGFEGALEGDDLLFGVGFELFGCEEVVDVFALEPVEVELVELFVADL